MVIIIQKKHKDKNNPNSPIEVYITDTRYYSYSILFIYFLISYIFVLIYIIIFKNQKYKWNFH